MSNTKDHEPIILRQDVKNIIQPGQRFSVPKLPLILNQAYDVHLKRYDFTLSGLSSAYISFNQIYLEEDISDVLSTNDEYDLNYRRIIQIPHDFKFRGDATNNGLIALLNSIPIYSAIVIEDLTYEQIESIKIQMFHASESYDGITGFEQTHLGRKNKTELTCDNYTRRLDKTYGLALIDPLIVPDIQWQIDYPVT